MSHGRVSMLTERSVRWRSTTTIISTRRSFSPSVDYGSDHPSVRFDGGEAYPEQVSGLAYLSFVPRLRLVCWEVSFHVVVRSYGSMLLQDAVGPSALTNKALNRVKSSRSHVDLSRKKRR